MLYFGILKCYRILQSKFMLLGEKELFKVWKKLYIIMKIFGQILHTSFRGYLKFSAPISPFESIGQAKLGRPLQAYSWAKLGRNYGCVGIRPRLRVELSIFSFLFSYYFKFYFYSYYFYFLYWKFGLRY